MLEAESLTAPQQPTDNSATWILGGLLVAAAIGVYALEKKGPEAVRYRRA